MRELLIDPEDGESTFLRNVRKLVSEYTESNIRCQCAPQRKSHYTRNNLIFLFYGVRFSSHGVWRTAFEAIQYASNQVLAKVCYCRQEE
jgi:hypothetical protein